MEKYVQVSASFHIQNPFGIQSFHFFFFVVVVTVFLQFIDCCLCSLVNILHLSYFHCLLKIHWTKNRCRWLLLEFSYELLWLWEPIDPNMLPNNCMSGLYSWVNSLYSFLNVWGFMFYCISPDLSMLSWIKCICGSNRSKVTTGANFKAFYTLLSKVWCFFFFFLNEKPGARKTEPILLEKRVFGKNRDCALASQLAKKHQWGTCWCAACGIPARTELPSLSKNQSRVPWFRKWN